MKVASLAQTLRGRIPEDQFRFSYERSGGPGGQNVNKVSTRATLLFDLAGAARLSNAEKRRVGTNLRTRVTKSGHIRVVSMRHRTQRANRRAAIERFYELVAEALHRPKSRKATRTPKRAHQRRLREKKKRGARKESRARVSTNQGLD